MYALQYIYRGICHREVCMNNRTIDYNNTYIEVFVTEKYI